MDVLNWCDLFDSCIYNFNMVYEYDSARKRYICKTGKKCNIKIKKKKDIV